MMLSYHGSEHYNSVRDDSAGKPPPPSKALYAPTLKKSISIESEGDETEVILENGEDTMEIDEIAEKEDKPLLTAKPPKKKDPCRCGSGLRYKKCCLDADKSKERARKWKEKRGSSAADDHAMEGTNDEHEEKMDGNFRVLKI